jgi:hypothetical protein
MLFPAAPKRNHGQSPNRRVTAQQTLSAKIAHTKKKVADALFMALLEREGVLPLDGDLLISYLIISSMIATFAPKWWSWVP